MREGGGEGVVEGVGGEEVGWWWVGDFWGILRLRGRGWDLERSLMVF